MKNFVKILSMFAIVTLMISCGNKRDKKIWSEWIEVSKETPCYLELKTPYYHDTLGFSLKWETPYYHDTLGFSEQYFTELQKRLYIILYCNYHLDQKVMHYQAVVRDSFNYLNDSKLDLRPIICSLSESVYMKIIPDKKNFHGLTVDLYVKAKKEKRLKE